MSGKGLGPVNKEKHLHLAEDAERRAAQEKDRQKRENLENLARQHRNIANTGKPEGNK